MFDKTYQIVFWQIKVNLIIAFRYVQRQLHGTIKKVLKAVFVRHLVQILEIE